MDLNGAIIFYIFLRITVFFVCIFLLYNYIKKRKAK